MKHDEMILTLDRDTMQVHIKMENVPLTSAFCMLAEAQRFMEQARQESVARAAMENARLAGIAQNIRGIRA
jgi:hypothetical protein